MANEERYEASYEEEPTVGFTVRDFLYIVFRHKWKMIVFFFIVSTLGFIVIKMMPKIFVSHAEVSIRLTSREARTGELEPIFGTGGPLAIEMQNAKAIMENRDIALSVVRAIGSERILAPPPRARLLEKILPGRPAALPEPTVENAGMVETNKERVAANVVQANLEVKIVGTRMIATYDSTSPRLAQECLTQVLNFFQTRYIEVISPVVKTEFYESELKLAQDALLVKQREVQEFRNQHNITNMQNQMEGLLETIKLLETGIRDASAQVSLTEARIRSFERDLAELERTKQAAPAPTPGAGSTAPAPSALTNPTINELERRLMNLRIQEAKDGLRYPENARPLVEVRSEIKIIEDAIQSERAKLAAGQGAITQYVPGEGGIVVPVMGDPRIQQIQTLLTSEKAALEGYGAQVKIYTRDHALAKASLAALKDVEKELRGLEGEEALLERNAQAALEEYEESKRLDRIKMENLTNVSIISQPSYPFRASKPNKTRNFALVLFMAFFGALGLAFVIEYLDNTLKTNDDVRKHLGLPVLATVSKSGYKSCT
jgi:uncharacterized protein involved in exopolysaccharide biosynthesis